VRDAQPAVAAIPAMGNQEMVILFAAGNDGPGAGSVGAPGTAKNVITVGAAENVHSHSTANGGNTAAGTDGCGITDTGADNANDIIGFSSRGPCTDGRKKPEIVAPGTHVTGGVFQASGVLPANGMADACFDAGVVCALPGSGTAGDPDNFFPLGQQWYTTSSGTSHSTPAVSGVAALIRQHFINLSLAVPSPALTKALLMNTARYMNGVGANDTLWSNNQGMGEANLNSFFDVFVTPSIIREQSGPDTFTASGQQRVITGTISDNTKPFRATLTWTDAPGPTVGNAFINNLDLEVTVGGSTYKGNVFSGAFSTTGGAADFRNNAESVFIPAGVTGTFIIKVKATNIAGDGVPNVGGLLDQDFALVVYNAVEAPVAVVEAAGATITAESCSPANGALDPNETVTVNLSLQNVGTANTTNLVATLQSGGGVSSPSGPQNYGVLVAGGPAVSRPFTFTVSANCGDIVTATLQLQDGATNLGTVTFTFTVGTLTMSSVTATYSSGNIAVPIPDLTSAEVPITVPDVGVVSDINVKLRLNHTFDGDLDIFLIGPDGTTVELSTDNGGAGDNFGSGANDCSGNPTIFDDEAGTAITAGTVPFVGPHRPEQMLSGFDGKRSQGTWKLRIEDDAGGDIGTIGCVQLEISRRRFRCCGIVYPPEIMAAPPVTVTAESCSPGNGAVDPDELVTVQFPLKNVGLGDSTNLVATLLPGGGVNNPSGPQNYGVVMADGPPVSRGFTFIATGTCGSNITATFQLQDGATNLGTVTFTIQLGTTVVTMSGPFANPAAITIPATGTGAAAGAPATPYPSTINVAALTGTVTKVTATISNFSHTFPGDVDILLVGPAGQKMILMSDVGGGTDAVNVTITFDDAAASNIGATVVSGTFRPTNSGTGDLFPAPAPAAPYGAALSDFNGTNPNGTWSLFVVDDAGADIGTIAGGWSLTITTAMPVCCVAPCMLSCPSNITVSNDPNQCGAVVNYTVPPFSGSCGSITANPPSGSFFPVGTTTVTIKATKTDGTMTTCTFTVKVNDTQPPTIGACPANITALVPVNNACSPASCAVVNFPTPTTSDNCSSSVVCSPPTGSCFTVGTTTVTCTATDTSNNTASCSFAVTVFNGCLQDDANPGNVVLFNTFTGDYRFCCGGVLIKAGKGSVTAQGCTFTIQHNTTDRRVMIRVSFTGNKSGTASLQAPPGTIKCSISDSNITNNNNCNCGS
jgi:subtilisin-like proprotein convertase family protein